MELETFLGGLASGNTSSSEEEQMQTDPVQSSLRVIASQGDFCLSFPKGTEFFLKPRVAPYVLYIGRTSFLGAKDTDGSMRTLERDDSKPRGSQVLRS